MRLTTVPKTTCALHDVTNLTNYIVYKEDTLPPAGGDLAKFLLLKKIVYHESVRLHAPGRELKGVISADLIFVCLVVIAPAS